MARSDTLHATDMEGVYINDKGVHVNKHGVAISFLELKKRDAERLEEVFGAPVRECHEYMKAVSMDPRHSTAVRMDAAYKAAPYFAMKKDANNGGQSETADEFAAKTMEALRALDEAVVAPPVAPAKTTKGAKR